VADGFIPNLPACTAARDRAEMPFAQLVITLIIVSVGIEVFASSAGESTGAVDTTPATLGGPVLDDSTVITLERGPCFGHCSEYSVSVYGSGRVEFEGRHYVCAKGRHVARASPGDVRVLVAQMLAVDYFDFYWRQGSLTTNEPTVISSLRHGGRMRRIEHNLGDAGAPHWLRRVEDRIDAVAGTWRWLPDREEGRRVCFREDGSSELLEIFSPD
jgi:hypothetical protein